VPNATKISPLAQAIAADTGVDVQQVAGSGTGGRILANDVRTPPAQPSLTPVTNTRTLMGIRKRVADNLSKSVREKPHVTLHTRVDMVNANKLRADLLPVIEKSTGIRLSPTDIVMKACAVALTEFPLVNAHIEGDTITLFDSVHIGLAVSLGDEGLIVPVIRDVQTKGLSAIATARNDVATRARGGKLASSELSGGTFTITNLGNYGIEAFNPIIPPPQVAILGVCSIQDEVVAINGVPTVRPRMGLSLSFDHRAIDGAPAAAFLARVREIIENPALLLA
jgi:pyruvate dehydrogenase E2 component (dihydrolipoamide acetyltransferase)